MRAELIAPVGAELGEGPTLFPDGAVWWVDLLAGNVYRWANGSNTEVMHFAHEVSKVLPSTEGFVVLGRESLIFFDSGGGVLDERQLHGTTSNLRCSDGVVLPDGSIAFGVVDRDLAPERGRLARIDTSSQVSTLVSGTTIANGIAVLADQTRVAWTDSPTHRIDVFDIDLATGGLVNRRPWFTVPEDLGIPDGLCADGEGGVWVAMWGGSVVVRFDERGRKDAIVDVGVPHVTSCAFDQGNNLIITTAAVLLSGPQRAAAPGSGGLWAVAADVIGVKRADTFVASERYAREV